MARFSIEEVFDRYRLTRENWGTVIALPADECIELRDLLLQHFPLPMSEAEFLKPATDLMDATYQAARRERIATAVLAGLMANGFGEDCDDTEWAEAAVAQADALIAALDEEKP